MSVVIEMKLYIRCFFLTIANTKLINLFGASFLICDVVALYNKNQVSMGFRNSQDPCSFLIKYLLKYS